MLKVIGNFEPFGLSRLKCNPSMIETRFFEDGIEIDWANNEIIWSKNRCLLHHLTMSAKVKEAIICTVDSVRYLAVLYESGLTLFSFSGQSYMIPLPFPISKIFTLHRSILLVRAQTSSYLQEQYSDFPILFTLYHPLEEIRPVAFNDTMIKKIKPKFATIMSPSPRKTPLSSIPKTEETLCFITDSAFTPLHVSNERVFMVAKTNEIATVYKFIEPTSSRELLFSSPHFRRSPSIFSPPRQYNGLNSPGTQARSEIQATLEGIPPDLFIESLYDFEFKSDTNYSSFCEISDGSRKYLIFVHEGFLDAIDISYVDGYKTMRWLDDAHQVLTYDQLMYFVVHNNGNLSLFEEDRMIAHFDIKDVVNISRLGKRFILTFQNGKQILANINISSNKLISSVLEIAHLSVSKEYYATFVLALSECGALSNPDSFFDSIFNLLISFENDSELVSFFTALHLLFEDMKIRKGTEENRKKILKFLIKLAKHCGMINHLLYYAMNSDEEVDIKDINKGNNFTTEIHDLMGWCSQCVSGKSLVEVSSPFSLSEKVTHVFGSIHSAEDAKTIVVLSEREKLTLKQIMELQPALSIPLQRIFHLTRDSPPEDWPIAAYKLIGRDDIAKLLEYIKEPFDNLNSPQAILPDLRFLEVERLLQSHLPVTIDVERPNGTDDIVYQSMMVSKLRILLEKQWSLSIGRGMFNLRSVKPLPSQKLVPEELNKVGYTTNGTQIVDTDDNAQQQAENIAATTWAQFNNGVSDGLTVSDASHSWIVDTISKEYTPYSAGILYGFAVNGLLRKLWKLDIFQYLTSPDIKEINAIAMVFGLGISYRGTRDLAISHMLTMHIPELRQFQQSDYEMSSLIKSAAIFGIGFLFESSANRHLTEVFAQLLEKSAIFDLATLPLSLGAAIGLISLGMGDKSPVLKETRERLCIILEGSKTADVSNEKIATFGNSDFFSIAPAAIFVLALGYMRTDHKRVQNALNLPADSNFINKMIPDVVLMRTCASLLVDSDPYTAINFVVPEGLEPDILASLVTGFSIACGIKFAGTMNSKAYERLMTIAKCLALFNKTPFDFTDCTAMHREVCLVTVVLAMSYIIAGTCDANFLRFVRLIRRRPCMTSQPLFVSGQQAFLSMAVGTLNLGKGRFTLSRSNSASAMLLLASYPRIAKSCGDNEYSLQTMRHLVNSAAVPRVLEVRDVDNDEIVNMKILLTLKDGEPIKIHTPHVLPPFEDIISLQIEDENYYKINISTMPFKDENTRPILWVKKRENTEIKEDYDVENLRAIFKMKLNPIFQYNTSEKDEMLKLSNELEWDDHVETIVQFFREMDPAKRLKILHTTKCVKTFLQFYGISPSVSLSEIGVIDDDALAFLIPHLSPAEISQAI